MGSGRGRERRKGKDKNERNFGRGIQCQGGRGGRGREGYKGEMELKKKGNGRSEI